MKVLSSVVMSGLLLATIPPARAHHGRDFILVQDAHSPSALSGDLFSGLEWSQSNGDDEFGGEAGMLLGLGKRIALGTTLDFGDEGDGWNYSSVTPFLHIGLTPPDAKWPVRIALMAGYEFAEEPETRTITTYVQVPVPTAPPKQRRPAAAAPPVDGGGGNGGGDPGPCGPEYGPDAPPCPEVKKTSRGNQSVQPRHGGHTDPPPPPPSSSPSVSSRKTGTGKVETKLEKHTVTVTDDPHSTGIHRHGENAFHSRLILEADLSESDKFVFNLINLVPESGKPAWGYAAGLRHSFTHQIAAGIEALGDFGDANEHELVLGGNFSPSHAVTLKLGVGIGLTEESSDFSIRTGLVWHF